MVILLIIEFVIVSTSYYFSVIRSNYPLHMLQLEGYNNEDYKTWIKNNKSKVSKFVYKKTEEKTPLVWTDRAKRLFKIHDHVNLAFLVGFIMITDIIYANTKSYYSTIVLVILCLILYYFEYKIKQRITSTIVEY